MATLDLAALAPVLMVLLLVAFFAALFAMRDTTHAAPHVVSRRVWCSRHNRAAVVEFIERVQTGMAIRHVLHCPLRDEGERCGEACTWEAPLPGDTAAPHVGR